MTENNVVSLVPSGGRRITIEDINEGREILGVIGSFAGAGTLENPFLTEVCFMIHRGDTISSISAWLKERDRTTGQDCYVSSVTLSEFRKNWYKPLLDKAVEGFKQNDYQEITLAGITFSRKELERQGMFDEKSAVKSQQMKIDGKEELYKYFNFVNEQLETDNKNRIHWSKERRYTIETYLKLIGEEAQSPQLHLELLQKELNIFVEAWIQSTRKVYGSEREQQLMEEFEDAYNKLALIRGSIMVDSTHDEEMNNV